MLFFQTHVCLTCPSLFTKFISFSSRLITVFNPWGLRYVFMLAILSWFCFDSIADVGGQRGYRIYVIRVRKQGAERGRTLWTFEGFRLFFLLSMYLLPKDTKSAREQEQLNLCSRSNPLLHRLCVDVALQPAEGSSPASAPMCLPQPSDQGNATGMLRLSYQFLQ